MLFIRIRITSRGGEIMKKININECLNELNIVESSEETMKKINGGCTITVGRCLKDGSYFIAAVKNKCGSYNTHKNQALNAAKGIAKGSYVTFNY